MWDYSSVNAHASYCSFSLSCINVWSYSTQGSLIIIIVRGGFYPVKPDGHVFAIIHNIAEGAINKLELPAQLQHWGSFFQFHSLDACSVKCPITATDVISLFRSQV